MPAAPTPSPEKKNPLGGRLSLYTEAIGDHICEQLSSGKSLVRILREMPLQGLPKTSPSMVYRWLTANLDFQKNYARAREEQADTNADEMLDIADETPLTKTVYDKEGNPLSLTIDSAYVQWQKQRIEARKWNAMKLKPKKYGDKLTVGGDAEAPVVVKQSFEFFETLLKSIELQRHESLKKG